MKIIKIAAILAVIALSFTLNADRATTERNKNTNAKKTANKALTVLKQGGSCSTAVFDVTITIDGNANKIAATFDARELRNPSGESVRGWKLNIPNLGDLGAKVFYKAEGNSYFLAYRLVSSGFSSDAPQGAGKTISATVQNSSTEVHSVVFTFNFDPNWDVIEDNVLSRITSWLNTNRSNRWDLIKGLKTQILAAMQDYVSNQKIANLAGSDAAAITKQIDDLKTQVKNLQAANEQNTIDLNNNNVLIQQQRTKISGIEGQKSTVSTALTQLQGKKSSLEDNINRLNDDIKNNTGEQSSYKSKYESALRSIDDLLATHREECANEGGNLDTARNSLVSQKNTDSFNLYVKKAFAVNS